MTDYKLNCRGNELLIGAKPLIMGILNVTPDSFSDGGKFFDPAAAINHGLAMAEDGAGIIDIGGESTRPGAESVPADEQIKRVAPVIKELTRQISIPISIDTTDSKVSQAAIEAGAGMINDVSALRFDKHMAKLAAKENVPIILMHMLGEPRTMQKNPVYDNVVQDVKNFLAERIEYAVNAGIDRTQIVIDPGIGFGKTLEHNLQLLRHIKEFKEPGVPVLVGPSRKSFIGKILGVEKAEERLWGTAAAVAWCAAAGVHIIRVHDVKEMVQVVEVVAAIKS
ncbi:MAG: dihydropteroate synthase [Sedimentisphaerales bacterium]|nr:dihydropteroate synthase [Sedimentisphaerales bacterium]